MYCMHSEKLVIIQRPIFLIGQDIHTIAVNELQLWFRRFQKGNYDISDKTGRWRRSSLNEEILKETSELAPPESNKDFYAEISWSTVHGHLKRTGETCTVRISAPRDL